MLEDKKEKARNQSAQREAETHKRAAAYHRAFIQNEAGKNVLDNWIQQHCMKPVQGDPSLFELGKAEGKRELIQEILNHITLIENEG